MEHACSRRSWQLGFSLGLFKAPFCKKLSGNDGNDRFRTWPESPESVTFRGFRVPGRYSGGEGLRF